MSVRDLEANRRSEQRRLDSLKGAKERNRLGQFATPPALATDITRYALRLRADRPDRADFLDPCLGTGSFYSAFRRESPADLIGTAAGVELDPAFASAARSLWGASGLEVIEGDFTRQEPGPRFNLILTNPPYVRHHHLSLGEKARLKGLVRDRFRIAVSGLAGLYCHILLLADSWMADGGLAAWLVPSEFMEVNYGSSLKEYLTDRVKLLHIHRFCPSDVQFCDALVTSVVVVFEKKAPGPEHEVRMSFGGPISDPTTQESVPLQTLRSAKKWTAFPRTGQPPALETSKLGDFFTIKRGLVTGANSFFIVERERALSNGIPDEFLRPILPSSRHLSESLIDTCEDGYPRLETRLGIIDCPLPEPAVRERFPRFWEYLEAGKRQGIHQGYLASRRRPWYSQEKREAAPFLCTYMGRKRATGNPFRFFLNRSRATAANVYLLLYPKLALKQALEQRAGLYPQILSLLESIPGERLIQEGRVYGGGLHKLEPRELASLPADSIVEAIGQLAIPNESRSPARGACRRSTKNGG